MRKYAGLMTSLSLALAATTGTAALAQAQPAASTVKLDVGAKVHDSEGVELGPIASNDGSVVVVDFGGRQAALPANVFAQTDKGLAITITAAQLTAALDKQAADAAAALETALVPGAEIRGVGGTSVVGKVKSADADGVVVATDKGEVRVPRKAFFLTGKGLAMSFTADQFAAALAETATTPAAADTTADAAPASEPAPTPAD